ncbi:MAG: hypothetical protein MI785_02900 [Kiloniellales bacterium]|nr:hypothetical protein [Kiloniellales bacterium]
MAKIWPVYEGREPTGWSWIDLPLLEAVDLFELSPDDHVTELTAPPRFGTKDRDLGHQGYKYVVVEIERTEGRRAGWKPGFYRSRLTPSQAHNHLIWQALASALGEENLVRVEFERTTDSQGHEALKITVVIAPNATQNIQGEKVIDALVKVQKRLLDMRDDRTPIIEYATEAELVQDGTS